MQAPVLTKSIPPQIVNERAAYGPVNLKEYIKTGDGDAPVRFQAEIKGGAALPKGLICTMDGILTGIPAQGTQGSYEIVIKAANDEGPLEVTFPLTIKVGLSANRVDYLDQLKAQVWVALDQRLPVPDIEELYNRPITALEIYYLLERWAILKVWDAFNLEPAGPFKEIQLEGASPHYHVYDRGSHIVAVPKDLFSHERSLEDSLKTARAMAREVYKRNWTVELAGFDKMTRACWVELQHLGDKFGHQLDVINFDPTPDDVKIYSTQVFDRRFRKGGGE